LCEAQWILFLGRQMACECKKQRKGNHNIFHRVASDNLLEGVRGLHRIAGARSSYKILGAASGSIIASPGRHDGEILAVSVGACAKVTFHVDSHDSL
jgi:hypothetical protein